MAQITNQGKKMLGGKVPFEFKGLNWSGPAAPLTGILPETGLPEPHQFTGGDEPVKTIVSLELQHVPAGVSSLSIKITEEYHQESNLLTRVRNFEVPYPLNKTLSDWLTAYMTQIEMESAVSEDWSREWSPLDWTRPGKRS